MKVRTACLCGIVFLTAGFCISGCGSERDENCLTIKKSGAVNQRIVEDFEEENYDLEELRAKMEEEMDDYNGQAGGNSVELTQLKESGGKLTMVTDYSSLEAYNEFNETALFSGTIEEALKQEEKGYFSQENLIKAKDGSQIKTEEVVKDGALMAIIVEEPVLYELEKKILYYSENMEFVSDKCARLKDAQSGPGYLIYKK